MQELIGSVEALILEEYRRANEKFSMFHSDHEGFGVIEEEIRESEVEFDAIADAFEKLVDAVCNDLSESAKRSLARDLRRHAIWGACELIQVATMALKFEDSMVYRVDEPEFLKDFRFRAAMKEAIAKLGKEEK